MSAFHFNPADVALTATTNASANAQQQYRFLWQDFLASVQMSRPYINVPKGLGDQLGTRVLEKMALRFCIIFAGDVSIQFNPAVNAYQIGPPSHLPNAFVARQVFCARYRPHSMVLSSNLDVSSVTPLSSPVRAVKTANCFILYRKDKQEEVKTENPGIHCKDIFIVGAMWASESAEVKEHYRRLADGLKNPAQLMGQNKRKAPADTVTVDTSNVRRVPKASWGIYSEDKERYHPATGLNTTSNNKFLIASQNRSSSTASQTYSFVGAPQTNPCGAVNGVAIKNIPAKGVTANALIAKDVTAYDFPINGGLSDGSLVNGFIPNPFDKEFADTLPTFSLDMFAPYETPVSPHK